MSICCVPVPTVLALIAALAIGRVMLALMMMTAFICVAMVFVVMMPMVMAAMVMVVTAGRFVFLFLLHGVLVELVEPRRVEFGEFRDKDP